MENYANGKPKSKKKKVLLMGKSGSGKSSMRSIVFSNYVAKDTRRLGATIDVEHSHVKFLGNLTLNLWDCGGQDAFMTNYLATQRDHVFANVGVLIYVFDIESREFERDCNTYITVIKALAENSPQASVFCLIHKMDLIQAEHRQKLFDERVAAVAERSEHFKITAFATSIWDQTLYKAWASIIYTLIPNLKVIEQYLQQLTTWIDAEEIVLFERTTFLVVTSVTRKAGYGNPYGDRYERLSNIIKTFKHSLSKFTGLPRASPQFSTFDLKTKPFSSFLTSLTPNTYVLVVLPYWSESRFNIAQSNILLARERFKDFDITGDTKGFPPGPAEGPTTKSAAPAEDADGEGDEGDEGDEGSF